MYILIQLSPQINDNYDKSNENHKKKTSLPMWIEAGGIYGAHMQYIDLSTLIPVGV